MLFTTGAVSNSVTRKKEEVGRCCQWKRDIDKCGKGLTTLGKEEKKNENLICQKGSKRLQGSIIFILSGNRYINLKNNKFQVKIYVNHVDTY